MAKYANADDLSGVIRNWMSNQNSFAFYSLWEEINNPELAKEGNIRDFTDILHLIILNKLENLNAELIEMGMSQQDRLVRLNNSAKKQIELLQQNENIKQLSDVMP